MTEEETIKQLQSIIDTMNLNKTTNISLFKEDKEAFQTALNIIQSQQAEIESLKKAGEATEKVYRVELEKKDKEIGKLNAILEAGLSKNKQYCFHEDGHTGKCLGYGSFYDDEPCDYCKSCERLSVEEQAIF